MKTLVYLVFVLILSRDLTMPCRRFFSLGENYLIQFPDAEASQYYHSFWSFDATVFDSMRRRVSETVVDLTDCEASILVGAFSCVLFNVNTLLYEP